MVKINNVIVPVAIKIMLIISMKIKKSYKNINTT